MPHQPELFPPELPRLESERPPVEEPEAHATPVWYQRLSITVLVAFCFYVGFLLFLLPWSRYWQPNQYLLSWTALASAMNSGITRGLVSGLGLLDVWIGIAEIVHYREQRR